MCVRWCRCCIQIFSSESFAVGFLMHCGWRKHGVVSATDCCPALTSVRMSSCVLSVRPSATLFYRWCHRFIHSVKTGSCSSYPKLTVIWVHISFYLFSSVFFICISVLRWHNLVLHVVLTSCYLQSVSQLFNLICLSSRASLISDRLL